MSVLEARIPELTDMFAPIQTPESQTSVNDAATAFLRARQNVASAEKVLSELKEVEQTAETELYRKLQEQKLLHYFAMH